MATGQRDAVDAALQVAGVFSVGALALVYFVISLWLWPKPETEEMEAPTRDRPPVGAKPESTE